MSGHDPRRADDLMVAEEALSEHVRARRFSEAGRLAHQMGRFADAGRYFTTAAMWMEAATCFYKGGHFRQSLDAMVRTSKDHPQYSAVCQRALRIAREHGGFDLSLDQFVSRFLATPPRTDPEVEAFVCAAILFEQQGMHESVAATMETLLTSRPQHHDAALRLRRARLASTPKPGIDESAALESFAFEHGPRRAAPNRAIPAGVSLPHLPELPPLPPPPALSAPAPVVAPHAPRGVPPEQVADALGLYHGAMLAGRYRIDRILGTGGMGAVYKARDTALDEEIAVKVFRSESSEHLARFKQEVAISRKLAHPNVIRLYDYGADGPMRFLTMELLEGKGLDECLRGPLSVRLTLQLLLQCCAGLGAAHADGTVHRDIKPANFFVLGNGAVKLVDFGIAKRAGGGQLTVAGFIAGTPHYMAPEQIDNFAQADARSDIYSIGIVAFEMLTGSVPFDHENLLTLLKMQCHDRAPLLRALRPDAPEALEALVDSMLAKDPADRPQSCEALSSALQDALRLVG